MLARIIGTAAVAVLAGGAHLLAGCGSFGTEPAATGSSSGGSGGGGGGGAHDGGGGGTDVDGAAAGPSTVTLIGKWQDGTNVTIPAGTNRLLLVTVHIEDGSRPQGDATVSSVKLGQQTLARAPEVGRVAARDGENAVEIWYLDEAGIAAAADGLLEVATSHDPREVSLFTHAFFSGVDQSEPFGPRAKSTPRDGDTVVVGPVLAPKDSLVVAVCAIADEAAFTVGGASLGVVVANNSHSGATAWAQGAGADLTITFAPTLEPRRPAAAMLVLLPAR